MKSTKNLKCFSLTKNKVIKLKDEFIEVVWNNYTDSRAVEFYATQKQVTKGKEQIREVVI